MNWASPRPGRSTSPTTPRASPMASRWNGMPVAGGCAAVPSRWRAGQLALARPHRCGASSFSPRPTASTRSAAGRGGAPAARPVAHPARALERAGRATSPRPRGQPAGASTVKTMAVLNWEQELRDGLGTFARLSWNDGRAQNWMYTEMDWAVSAGLSWRVSGAGLGAGGGYGGPGRQYRRPVAQPPAFPRGRRDRLHHRRRPAGLRPELAAEAYYRMGLAPGTDLTADCSFSPIPPTTRIAGRSRCSACGCGRPSGRRAEHLLRYVVLGLCCKAELTPPGGSAFRRSAFERRTRKFRFILSGLAGRDARPLDPRCAPRAARRRAASALRPCAAGRPHRGPDQCRPGGCGGALGGTPGGRRLPAGGETVLLVLRHGPALYAAFLGCMMAGCVPAFLAFPTPKQDPVLYWQALAALLRRIGAAGLITYPENAAPLRA